MRFNAVLALTPLIAYTSATLAPKQERGTVIGSNNGGSSEFASAFHACFCANSCLEYLVKALPQVSFFGTEILGRQYQYRRQIRQ